MVNKKTNYTSLEPFLKELVTKYNLRLGGRSWWPQFIYHSTEINDAISILNTGYVYSRNLAIKMNLLKFDIASQDVIDLTPDLVKDFARFYFRPQTPTQWNNEGIRLKSQLSLRAQCPVPVYLLFDAIEVLSLEQTQFSKGNLATWPQETFNDISELKKFPFDLIYHVGGFPPSDRDKITYHRNAEIIVPDKLSVKFLRLIYCRSEAEKDTLLNLINDDIARKWHDFIIVDIKGQFFHKRWTFIDKTQLANSYIILSFSPESQTPGPFNVRFKLYDIENDIIHKLIFNEVLCNRSYKFPFKKNFEEYNIQIYLDDMLSFKGYHKDYDLPF